MPKSRFFRVAVEGATTDGRTIDRKWLEEMAQTYNRDTYAARVNMEHIRGITADPPFQSLGDVLSLKTEEIAIDLGGKQEKRLALFAEIDALEPLVAMNRKRQKLYTSIEVNPSFANTGKAYLVGLAVTDSPASLGTEMLEFCAKQGDKSPLAARKQDPANLFTAAEEVAIELVEDAQINPDPTGVFAAIKGFVTSLTAAPAAAVPPAAAAPAAVPASAPAPVPAADAPMAALTTLVGQLATTVQGFVTQAQADHGKLRADFDALQAKLEATPQTGFTVRPAATGNEGRAKTDC
jgi:hypothetical protein